VALLELFVIAYRDLLRNRRRSLLTLLAVALGLALLIVWNGLITGSVENALQNSIRLNTGHVQMRAESYQEKKLSLIWKDLLDTPDELAARARELEEVKAAAPVLWASGIVNTADESVGLQVYGIQPGSPVHDPIREGLVAGEFLTRDDRTGILMGKRLADSLGTRVGQKVFLVVSTSDGQPDQGSFTIRGLFATGIPSYDQSTVFMPLAKAQAFTRARGRASSVVILLHEQDDAERVAATLRGPGLRVLTWQSLNEFLLTAFETGQSFYVMMDLIVILVVAVIIANTLLMAVFERIREMGVLAALGMKRRQILLMFLLEAFILGLAGVLVGIALGSAGVAYLARTGLYVGDIAAGVENLAYGTRMYAVFVPGSILSLSAWTLVITLLASLYPAIFAARLEPIDALHAL
jgi:ABC-type lipoprotein release transport system permease subunit